MELDKLSKLELLERVRHLQDRLSGSATPIDVHQRFQENETLKIELETQNRILHEIQNKEVHAREEYSDLYDFSPVGYISVDRDGIIRKINLKCASILNKKRSELIGISFKEFLLKDELPDFNQYLNNLNLLDEDLSTELKVQVNHAGIMTLRMESFGRSHKATRESGYYNLVLTDITANKLMERTLRDRESQLGQIADALPVLIAYIDINFRFRFNNKAFEDWFGLHHADIAGRHFRDVLGDAVYQSVQKHLQTNDSEQKNIFESKIRKKDGNEYDVTVTYILQYNELSNIVGFYLLISDISVRKNIGSALAEMNARLEVEVAERTSQLNTINQQLMHEIQGREHTQELLARERDMAQVTLASIGDAVMTVDLSGNVTFLNASASRLIGHSSLEVIGMPLDKYFTVFNQKTNKPIENVYKRCLRGDYIVPFEDHSLLKRKDGIELFIEGSAAPVHDKNASILSVVMVFRDVTKAREMSQQLTYQAQHDALTGLYNRREFERRLERVIETARKQNTEHALCYLDLDRFKQINDFNGHSAGDQLLRELSKVLQDNMRKRDTLARLGGDEFGVLLELCPADQAIRIANDLKRAVTDFNFEWEGNTYSVGVSIGVISISAESESVAGVLNAADTACYSAKRNGRNNVFDGLQ